MIGQAITREVRPGAAPQKTEDVYKRHEPEATAPASTDDHESSSDAPKTGDESSVALWVILLVAAAAGIGVAVYAGVRRKRAS